MLLRMENTDIGRCSRRYEDAIAEDLAWIGFNWQGEIRRQSEHFDHYASILDDLEGEGLAYPAFMTRGQVRHFIADFEENTGKNWPRDPDGGAHYPDIERNLDGETRQGLRKEKPNHALRLNMSAANDWLKRQHRGQLIWREIVGDSVGTIASGSASARENKSVLIEPISCEPEQWGDLVLGRREIPASYHLACVIDDNLQGVTHVVRGKDIMPATSIHRLLQEVLGLSDPVYCHHDLIVDDEGNKFSKRRGETSLREMREAGMRAEDIHKMIGIGP